jgi:hypothetical protein
LYHKHKGKIGVAFGKEAFTTPPIASFASLDAKFTTTDLAKHLKSWALFGPPLGRTWQPTQEQRQLYPEIKPLVSNPWTILHGNPPPAKEVVAVDVPRPTKAADAKVAKAEGKSKSLLNVPAWHGTLLPQSDGDIWLATAFADYEKIVAKDKTRPATLSPSDRDDLALDLFAFRSAYQTAVRASGDVPLADIKSDPATDDWYRLASGKGVLVLHELRRLLGDPVFEDMMDAFGRANAGKRVTTAQFQAHAERATGKPLGEFFDSWIKKPGLPAVRLGPVTTSLGGKSVQGEIHRDVQGPTLAKVDVTVETDLGEITKTIEVTGTRTAFTVEIASGRPRQIILEKYGNSVQERTKVFSIMSFHREQENTLIIYGTGDEVPTNREAAVALQKAIRESGPNFTLGIKADRDVTEADLQTHHLLLIGRPDSNSLVERFRRDLPITFGSRSFGVRGKIYANPGSAVVAAAANPLNKCFSLVVVAGLSAESTLNAPAAFLRRGQRAAEVLVLPNSGSAQAFVLPESELVRPLNPQ